MYYGDASITCSQENKAGVWDASYREVFHLHEAGDHTDSTKNAFTAAGKGSVTNSVTGQVGPAVALASTVTPGSINISDGTIPVATSLTLEAWVKARHLRRGQLRGPLREGTRGPQLRRGPRLGRGVLHHAPLRRLGRALQPRLGPRLQRLLVRLGVEQRLQAGQPQRPPTAGLVGGPERRLVPPRGLVRSGGPRPPALRQRRRGRERCRCGHRLPRGGHPPVRAARDRLERQLPQRAARRGPHVVRGPVGRLDRDGLQQPEQPRRGCGWVLFLGGPPAGPLRGGRRHRLPGPEPLRRRPRHVQPAVDRQHGGLLDRQRHLHRHQRILRGELPRRRLAERQPRPRRPHHDRRHRLPGAGRGQRDAAAAAHPVHRHDRRGQQGVRDVPPVRDVAGLGGLHLDRRRGLPLLHGRGRQPRDREPQRDRNRLQGHRRSPAPASIRSSRSTARRPTPRTRSRSPRTARTATSACPTPASSSTTAPTRPARS